MSVFRLSALPIDSARERESLLPQLQAGGLVIFEGMVRDHHLGRAVRGLRYEAYESLAQTTGNQLLQQARTRYSLRAAGAVHRLGELRVGELAVWVGVAADHRAAAFEACRWLIDSLKEEVPIWKLEHYTDHTEEWINNPLR